MDEETGFFDCFSCCDKNNDRENESKEDLLNGWKKIISNLEDNPSSNFSAPFKRNKTGGGISYKKMQKFLNEEYAKNIQQEMQDLALLIDYTNSYTRQVFDLLGLVDKKHLLGELYNISIEANKKLKELQNARV